MLVAGYWILDDRYSILDKKTNALMKLVPLREIDAGQVSEPEG